MMHKLVVAVLVTAFAVPISLTSAVVTTAPAAATTGAGKNGLIDIRIADKVRVKHGCARAKVKIRVPAVDAGKHWSVELATKHAAQHEWLSQGWDFNPGTGRSSTYSRTVEMCGIPSLSPYGNYRLRAVFKIGDAVDMNRRDIAFAKTKTVRG